MVTGHFSADHVARFQPMKFAAIEGLWKHENGPAGLIVFARPQSATQINSAQIKIPYAMSALTGYGLSGSPGGIREEVAEEEGKIREAIRARPLGPGIECARRLPRALRHEQRPEDSMLAFLFTLLALRLIRRGPGAPLLSASGWLRICGPDRLASA